MPWYQVVVLETTQRIVEYRIFRETEAEARESAEDAFPFDDDEDEQIEIVDEDHDFPVKLEIIECHVSPELDSDSDACRIVSTQKNADIPLE